MAKPSTRQELIDYCLRQLGEPVLEVNVDEDQIDDLVDDAIQFFQERHMDGVERMFLKHQIQQWEIDAARTKQIGSIGIHSQSFDGSNGEIVKVGTADTGSTGSFILPNHGLATGTQIFYSFTGAGSTSIAIADGISVPGIGTTAFLGISTDSVEYYAIVDSPNEIRVATSLANAKTGLGVTIEQVGVGATHFFSTKTEYTEARNYIEIPDHVIGVQGIFRFDDNTISQNMFSISYQIFLNDVYNFSSVELLNYTMVKEYLETIQFLISPDKKVRYNKRGNRLYIDMDWESQTAGDYLVIDCFRILDPSSNSEVYNDSYLKKYLTSLIKRQWGQNLMKFQGVQLPGGLTLNGRQLYEDALRELAELQQRMTFDYELPPLDLIG
tara:strand:- start:3595 stop:4743 length:1149 start_codon:yes stop_codon:yes gene_type:complete